MLYSKALTSDAKKELIRNNCHQFFIMVRAKALNGLDSRPLRDIFDAEMLSHGLEPIGIPLSLTSQADWTPLLESIARILLLYFELSPVSGTYVLRSDGTIHRHLFPDGGGVYPEAADMFVSLLMEDSLVRNVLFDSFSSAILRRIPHNLMSPAWRVVFYERLSECGLTYSRYIQGVKCGSPDRYIPVDIENHRKVGNLLTFIDLDSLLKRESLFKDEFRCLSIISSCERNLMTDEVYHCLINELTVFNLVPQTEFKPTLLTYRQWLSREGLSYALDAHTRDVKKRFESYVDKTKNAFEKKRIHSKVEKQENDKQIAQAIVSNKLDVLTRVTNELIDRVTKLETDLSCLDTRFDCLKDDVLALREDPLEGAESPQTGENPLIESETSTRCPLRGEPYSS